MFKQHFPVFFILLLLLPPSWARLGSGQSWLAHQCFNLGSPWCHLGSAWRYLGPTWGILPPLCHSLGLSCDPQGSPGLSLAVFGLLLASHRAPRGVILIPLGDIFAQLGVSWTLFATHWGPPASPRALHGAPGLSLAVLGLLLAPHRDHIGVYWRYLGAIWCKCAALGAI